jgi:hypothetical protein
VLERDLVIARNASRTSDKWNMDSTTPSLKPREVLLMFVIPCQSLILPLIGYGVRESRDEAALPLIRAKIW